VARRGEGVAFGGIAAHEGLRSWWRIVVAAAGTGKRHFTGTG